LVFLALLELVVLRDVYNLRVLNTGTKNKSHPGTKDSKTYARGLTSISSVAESVIVRTISTSPPTTVTFFSALAVVLISMDVNAHTRIMFRTVFRAMLPEAIRVYHGCELDLQIEP
jgi:hypothetical protein